MEQDSDKGSVREKETEVRSQTNLNASPSAFHFCEQWEGTDGF